MIACRLKQIREEGSFGMPRFVLTLRMVGRYLRVLPGKEEPHVLDGASLPDPRRPIYESSHDVVAQAARYELIE